MPFHVKAICMKCHRSSVLTPSRAITRDELKRNYECQHCQTVGEMAFLSSV